MPAMPTIEEYFKASKFFSKHNGNMINAENPTMTFDLPRKKKLPLFTVQYIKE